MLHDKCISSLLTENREPEGSMIEQDACVGVTSRQYLTVSFYEKTLGVKILNQFYISESPL